VSKLLLNRVLPLCLFTFVALRSVAACPDFAMSTFASGTTRPSKVFTGDFNNDGHADILAASLYQAAIHLGRGDGTFRAPQIYQTVDAMFDLATVDLNKDGKLDFVSVNYTPSTISIFIGNGDGTFTFQHWPSFSKVTRIDVGDFTGDGNPDLVIWPASAGDLRVIAAYGTVAIESKTINTWIPGYVSTIAVMDANDDGKSDLLVFREDTLSTFLNTGAGKFSSSAEVHNIGNARSARIVDVDGDGIRDVVAGTVGTADITVHLGKGNGVFGDAKRFGFPIYAWDIQLADFDGDGKLDVAARSGLPTGVAILHGFGDGTFAAPVQFPITPTPSHLATADFDGDGRPDLIAPIIDTNMLTLMLNRSRCAPTRRRSVQH